MFKWYPLLLLNAIRACSSAAERFLCKEEARGSNPFRSILCMLSQNTYVEKYSHPLAAGLQCVALTFLFIIIFEPLFAYLFYIIGLSFNILQMLFVLLSGTALLYVFGY